MFRRKIRAVPVAQLTASEREFLGQLANGLYLQGNRRLHEAEHRQRAQLCADGV